MSPERSKRVGIPVLPLYDVMVCSYVVVPLFIGQEGSIRRLEAAMNHNKKVMPVAQKEALADKPGVSDLLTVGAVAPILQMLKPSDGTVKVLAEGLQRARISALSDNDEHFSAEAEYSRSSTISERGQEALVRIATSQFEGYIRLNKKIPPEVLTSLNSIDDSTRLADTIAAYIPLKLADRQSALEMPDISERLEYLIAMMESEIDLLRVEKHTRNCIKKQMEKSQCECYLNEQMKAIQKELGEMDDTPDENEALKRKIDAAKIPREAKEKARAELQKLKMMSPMSTEATVVRGYVDWTIQMPWNTRNKVKKGPRQAQEILDTDHHGLERMKDRILEYLAVQGRANKIKEPILCLVGPPGAGKTSLGQFIAKVTGRKYVRMALGGICDEAGIHGHHRTCIGSMPGKLIQRAAKMGVKNPLFLLDEIGKMSSDMHSGPASALLGVLDPEQGVALSNYCLEVNYGLSDVMFVATSNSMNIPAPLLNRMEAVRLSGYTEDERLNIAKCRLLPEQIERNVLKKGGLTVDDSVIIGIIHYYTHEAGACGLKREISKLCRKAVKQLLLDKSLKHIEINRDNLHDYLGVQRFNHGYADNKNRAGQVTSLVRAEVGGDLLTIETACAPRKGELTYTGPSGGVMQEPTQVALTVVRAYVKKLGINPDFYEKCDIHVHVPEGVTPKDGPSVGITIYTALVSCLTGSPVRANVAMTGEITLRGQVPPIGDLKEELLVVHHGRVKTVLIPFENKRDLEEIPGDVITNLDIHPVKRIEEVLTLALQDELSGMRVVTTK